MNELCHLCGQLGAALRAGRLGRYALTCDRCEARRGLQLRNHKAEIAAGLHRSSAPAHTPKPSPTRSK